MRKSKLKNCSSFFWRFSRNPRDEKKNYYSYKLLLTKKTYLKNPNTKKGYFFFILTYFPVFCKNYGFLSE